jgi:hypothetical protein
MRPARPQGLPCFFALFLIGCSGSFDYIQSARARITDAPSIIAPVPHPKTAALILSARMNRTTDDSLGSHIYTGSLQGTQEGNYGVTWNPTTIGLDIRLVLNLEDPPGHTLAIVDAFGTINTQATDPWWSSASMAGGGVTFPTSFGYFRFAPALGQHRYRLNVIEATDPGECWDDCSIEPTRTYSERNGGLMYAWSLTAWWPQQLTGLPISQHIGYQSTNMLILLDDRTTLDMGPFSVRKSSFEIGLRHSIRYGSISGILSFDQLHHTHGDNMFFKTQLGLEAYLGRMKRFKRIPLK